MKVRKAQFRAAFEQILERGLSMQARQMLRAHWAAPRRTVSMGQLAFAAGLPKHSYANIQYGGLAKRIATYGAISVPKGHMALSAIATWGQQPLDARGHFAFTLRPELAAVLETFGLVDGAEAVPEFNTAMDALEGEVREQFVRHRQRESGLRMEKLRLAAETGRIRCEVPGCGFDFEKAYGALGAGFAEVHHLKPLSARAKPELTRLADLAIVCSNCHSMIHRFGACRPLAGLRESGRAF